MIRINANVNSIIQEPAFNFPNEAGVKGAGEKPKSQFADVVKAAGKYITKVEEQQATSDTSIKDFLSGKNEDITSVVSAVAKADIGFKVLVGVRNKLIEAYRQTMNMQI